MTIFQKIMQGKCGMNSKFLLISMTNLTVFCLTQMFFLDVSYAANPVICNQEYALCTSAPCIPDARNAKYAICDCVVKKGESAGYKTCKQRKPGQDKYKVTRLISTFSFEQFATKKLMNCTQGNP